MLLVVCSQIRTPTEKLASGIQIGTNYRLYSIERVSISFNCLCFFIRLFEMSQNLTRPVETLNFELGGNEMQIKKFSSR